MRHRRAHLTEAWPEHSRFREVPERLHVGVSHRDRVGRRSGYVTGDRRLGSMHEAINQAELGRGIRLISQQPLHAPAVKAMGWRNRRSFARVDHGQRMVAPSPSSFDLEFDFAAWRLDRKNYR